MMTTFSLRLLAGLAMSAFAMAGPAAADVFSSQTFSGDTATVDALPGVNLNVAPGAALNGNCVETSSPSFSSRGDYQGTVTECKFGNFSISTVNGGSSSPGYDTTYGGNPPPWLQGWHGIN